MTFDVLVLDDEPWQLSWLTDIVADSGGTCHFATTYDEAVCAFQKISPAIVVVDVRIGDAKDPPKGATLTASDPKWVGLRFLRHVRVERRSASTKLIVYTGLDREEIQRIAEDSFQAMFFTKFESGEFSEAFRAACKRLEKNPGT